LGAAGALFLNGAVANPLDPTSLETVLPSSDALVSKESFGKSARGTCPLQGSANHIIHALCPSC